MKFKGQLGFRTTISEKLRLGRFLFLLMIGVVLLSGCATFQDEHVTNEFGTATVLAGFETTVPPALLETATPALTLTKSTLSLNAQTLKNIVLSPCIPVEESLPDDVDIPWNLLVGGNPLYVFYPENGATEEISHFGERTPDGREIHISPDGKWLAYTNLTRTKLFVEPTETLLTNEDLNRIVLNKGFSFFLLRWVSNQNILAIYARSENSLWFPTVFLNPFTGEEHEFSIEDMPNYLDNHYGGAVFATHYQHSGELVPDPTMKKLIYPEKWGEDYGVVNTLWDIETEKPLARLNFRPGIYLDPLWAQDGSDVLLVAPNQDGGEEWFLVTADGAITQVTQFGGFLQAHSYYLYDASRSFDGRYLVFQLIYNQPDEIIEYILLDLKSNALEGYCIPLSTQNPNVKPPAWSPDSKYLVISDVDRYNNGDVVLVDVESKKAYKIAKEMSIIGWIVKP
jgi:hypothetical protein